MKILHVIPTVDPKSGGPVEGLKQLCHIYQRNGHEVEVASLDSPEDLERFNFPVRVFALGPGRGVYGYSSGAARWFSQNLANYAVVFINCIWQYNTLAAYRALRRSPIPYAVFTHGMLDPYFKERYPLKHLKKSIYWHLFLQRILQNANAVLFTCDEEKILARQSFPRYKVTEVVVPYGIFGPDCDVTAAAEEFLTKWPELRGKRLAISMGRIHPKKGTDILIGAFARAFAKDPEWQLVIAGPDGAGLQSELIALATRLGIAEKITWTGMLSGTLKWGALRASEVFVLPSHQENFGIVIAEAMSTNLPVIISNKVNIWREVTNYWAGLICEDTVDGAVACMARWQALTREEITALGMRSRKCFEQLFNYEVTAKKALEIVDHVASQTRRP
jgi:glycosyltransferase involved in cell wall biosynthesis